jgi:hypothetical protein
MPKGLSMYPVMALILLMLFIWIILMWASCGECDEHHDMKKSGKSSDEQDHWKAAMKQDIARLTASPRLQQKRSGIMGAKICRHTYVFCIPHGGCHGL